MDSTTKIRKFIFFQLLVFCAFKCDSVICGIYGEYRPSVRVSGGHNAAPNSAPYIVSFQDNKAHYCAGSIINHNWVLTAAHCLINPAKVRRSLLVAGTIYVSGSGETTQRRSIDHFVINDLYTGVMQPYDIGLVYTKTEFGWTDAVNAITLPTSGSVPSGTADLYGWGATSSTPVYSYPRVLQVAQNIPIINVTICEEAMGREVHFTNICTGPVTGGPGICNTDSGGPLVQTKSGTTVLIGIVSWGKTRCGTAPSVYVQVSSVISWISENQVLP